MAIRYDSQNKTGDLDISDNEGRDHRVRFGGAGTGNRVKTDVTFEFDPTCPDQLGLQCPSVDQGDLTFDQTAVTYTSNAVDVKLYVRPGDTLRPSDFQFDAILKTRAAANAAVNFVLQLTGYQNFTFIPVTYFTPVYEEIKRGLPWVYNYDRVAWLASNDKANFPEVPIVGNIGRQKFHNGGYHVKHNSWKNHRQNSTYCHICVPRLTDALGNESWGTVSYNPANGQLTYSLDSVFLANAPLPITLDPTFGDTTAGTDTFDMNADRVLAGIFSNPDSGVTLTKLTAYCDYTSAAINNKGLFFAVSAGAPTGDPLGVGAATAVPGAPAWTDFDMNDESLSVTDYALALIAPDFTGVWYKDISGGNDSHMDNGNSYSAPNSWAETSSYGGQMNIYATTASGGGTVVSRELTDIVSITDNILNIKQLVRSILDAASVVDSLSSQLVVEIAYDAVSESHSGTTGNTSSASFSWTHTPASAANGVVVAVVSSNGSGATSGEATGVTYGGVSMTAVTGGTASDTATEPGTVQTYFLGSDIPTGAQSVVVSRNNNTMQCYAVCISLKTSDGANTAIVGTPVLLQENGTFTEQAVDTGADYAIRLAFGYSGGANVLAMGASTTTTGASGQIDFGAYTFTSGYETTGGSGSRSVGFSFGTSDDRAGVHLAVKRYVAGGTVINRSLSDSVTVLDFAGNYKGVSRLLTENATMFDSLGAVKYRARLASDFIDVIDSSSKSIVRNMTLGESVVVIDALNRIASVVRGLSEYTTANDQLLRTTQLVRLLSDDASVIDSLLSVVSNAGNLTIVELSDAIQTNDSIQRVLGAVRSLDEQIVISDYIYRSIGVSRNLNDNIVVLDTLAKTIYQGAGVFTVLLTEYLTVSDSVQRTIKINRLMSEAIAISDYVARYLDIVRRLSDAAIVSDSIANTSKQLSRSLTDFSNVLDSLIKIQKLDRNLSESVDVYDALSITILRLITQVIRNAITGIQSPNITTGIGKASSITGISDTDEDTTV